MCIFVGAKDSKDFCSFLLLHMNRRHEDAHVSARECMRARACVFWTGGQLPKKLISADLSHGRINMDNTVCWKQQRLQQVGRLINCGRCSCSSSGIHFVFALHQPPQLSWLMFTVHVSSNIHHSRKNLVQNVCHAYCMAHAGLEISKHILPTVC